MKKSIFLGLMLFVAGSMFAARYYVMSDERALPEDANTSIMEKTDVMLWIRDWAGADGSLTCSLESSADAGPSGFPYLVFMCHPDNSGAPAAGYYGVTWKVLQPIDLTVVKEDWKMVIVCKTDVPVWTLSVVDGNKCTIDLAAKVEKKDNETWQTIEVPMYDIFDKGISFSEPLTDGYLFNMLTNENTDQTQLCIDAWYFEGEVSEDQGVENVTAQIQARKMVENGQIVILKNGVKYNALGTQL